MIEAGLAIEKPDVALNVSQYQQTPRLSKVIVYNDDFTPMEFVVDVLGNVFRLDEEYATNVMMRAHYEGKAVLGSYPTDIAETRVHKLNIEAQKSGYPLLCEVVNG